MHSANENLPDLKGMTPGEIDRFCRETLNQKPGRGLRLAALLFRNRIDAFEAMTDVSKAFREELAAACRISNIGIEHAETSEDKTKKLLYRLDDGNTVEGALIPGPGRLTLCISTQVGCASACRFCLTGGSGFVRNLSAAEIVNQVFAAERLGSGELSNLVLMGTGEPLDNYEAVRTFIEIATDRHGLGFSPKKITLSTCGIAPMIEKMADDGINASLAVSLNATTDEVRDRLMPVNRRFSLDRLLSAVRYYAGKTGKSVTIEYVLFGKVNDTNEDARRLVALLDGVPCMVNILMFNPFDGSSWERPAPDRVSVFRDILIRAGHIAVIRKSRGRDIGAACGQLRAAASRP